MNEFVKPNPYFVYYMFKDTIHVDDYGSIKETLFKFPTLNKVSYFLLTFRPDNLTKLAFIYSVTMSIQKFHYATMPMRMNGLLRNSLILTLASFTSALPQLLLVLLKF